MVYVNDSASHLHIDIFCDSLVKGIIDIVKCVGSHDESSKVNEV